MQFKHTLLTTALIAFATAGAAQAQNTGSATSGVKGEMTTPNQDKARSGKAPVESRSDVKAKAAAANASGPMVKGEQSTATQGTKPMAAGGSNTTRAEVKSEAAAARRAGSGPVGQESVKDQNKGGGAAAKP